jgi:hypothetical protein
MSSSQALNYREGERKREEKKVDFCVKLLFHHLYYGISRFDYIIQIKKYNDYCMEKINYELFIKLSFINCLRKIN